MDGGHFTGVLAGKKDIFGKRKSPPLGEGEMGGTSVHKIKLEII